MCVKSDGTADIANVKMSMNPFDEIAVEEAVRLGEAGTATEGCRQFAGVPLVARKPMHGEFMTERIVRTWSQTKRRTGYAGRGQTPALVDCSSR